MDNNNGRTPPPTWRILLYCGIAVLLLILIGYVGHGSGVV